MILILSGCAEKYHSFESNYRFSSENGGPDYSNLNYWAAHPWKWDPADSTPAPLKFEGRDSSVDVFFIHPTTFTKKRFSKINNASIDDSYINAKTDYSSILLQASAFNQHARVFAPRYRQAHLKNFYTKDTARARKNLEFAYADIRAAFIYYLQNFNQGRPIVIAGHSQGSLMSKLLLKEFFDAKPLEKKLVVAYLAGWPIPQGYFNNIPVCSSPEQTGCLCSWRTFKMGYMAPWVKKEKEKMLVTNTISWSTDQNFVSRNNSKGAVLMDFNKVYRNVADAQIKGNVLYTKRPHFPMSFLYRKKNYHVGDINLYYLDIRNNLNNRIGRFELDAEKAHTH